MRSWPPRQAGFVPAPELPEPENPLLGAQLTGGPHPDGLEGFREALIVIAIIMGIVASLAALACDGRHHAAAGLPTVSSEAIAKDDFQFCAPWDGVGPLLKRTPHSTEHRPDFFCFVGDACYYGCPSGAAGR